MLGDNYTQYSLLNIPKSMNEKEIMSLFSIKEKQIERLIKVANSTTWLLISEDPEFNAFFEDTLRNTKIGNEKVKFEIVFRKYVLKSLKNAVRKHCPVVESTKLKQSEYLCYSNPDIDSKLKSKIDFEAFLTSPNIVKKFNFGKNENKFDMTKPEVSYGKRTRIHSDYYVYSQSSQQNRKSSNNPNTFNKFNVALSHEEKNVVNKYNLDTIVDLYKGFQDNGLFTNKPEFLRDIPDFIRNSPRVVDMDKLIRYCSALGAGNGKTRSYTYSNKDLYHSNPKAFQGFHSPGSSGISIKKKFIPNSANTSPRETTGSFSSTTVNTIRSLPTESKTYNRIPTSNPLQNMGLEARKNSSFREHKFY